MGRAQVVLTVDRAREQVPEAPSRSEIAIADFVVPLTTTRTLDWCVLHTLSRQEKALSTTLQGAGIAHYLPLVRRVREYGHRRRVVQAPLFSSYVFMRGGGLEARFALDSGRVARVLPVADQTRFETEMGHIRRALEAGAELDVLPNLAEGRRVRVVTGAFKDLEGVVVQRAGRHRLILRVHALNQSTSLEVDAGALAPAE